MCFRRKIGKARVFRHHFPSTPLPETAARHHRASHVCIVHASAFVDNTAANVVNCNVLQSKLSHTRPRHGYESLSTWQFNVFAASGSAGEIFQYAFSASRRIRVFFLQLILKERRINIYEIAIYKIHRKIATEGDFVGGRKNNCNTLEKIINRNEILTLKTKPTTYFFQLYISNLMLFSQMRADRKIAKEKNN